MDDFDRILEHNLKWIYKTAYRYCRNKVDAEDLVGDTVYKLIRNKDKYDKGKGFRPWATSILQNTYITQYNRRKCLLVSDIIEADDEIAVERASSRAEFKDILSIVCMCARKSVCIECVILYAKGYTYDEIADIFGISVGTVKSRISAGRKMIAEALDK